MEKATYKRFRKHLLRAETRLRLNNGRSFYGLLLSSLVLLWFQGCVSLDVTVLPSRKEPHVDVRMSECDEEGEDDVNDKNRIMRNRMLVDAADEILGDIDFGSLIGGSKLDHQRYYTIWHRENYDITIVAFQKWLLGKRGNNTRRAGALTADMLNGHPQILQESAPWKKTTSDPGHDYNQNDDQNGGTVFGKPINTSTAGPFSNTKVNWVGIIGIVLAAKFLKLF